MSRTRTLTRRTRNGKQPLKAVISLSFERERVEEVNRTPLTITTIITHQEEVVEVAEVLIER